MNRMKKKHSKFLALLMVFVMLFTMIPTAAFAAAEPTIIYSGSDFPYKNYCVSTLTLSGADVSYITGTDVYLAPDTPQNAELTFEVTAGGRTAQYLGINWNDDKTNTMTYTTSLVDGKATVKVYAYKASGAGASKSGTKTFNIYIAAPNEAPVLMDGVSETVDATVTSGESYTLGLNKVFYDADGDTLSYKVSVDGASAAATSADYSYLNTIPGTYVLTFVATDGKTMAEEQPTHTVNLTVKNSETIYDVNVSVPEGVSPKFYAVNNVSGSTVIKGDELVFVNGIVKDVETRKIKTNKRNSQDKIDAVLTNRWLGIPIFAVVMFLVFQISQSWVGPYVADALCGWLEYFKANVL